MLRQGSRAVSLVAALAFASLSAPGGAAAERLFERRSKAAGGACDGARLLEPAAISVSGSGLDAIRGPCVGSGYATRARALHVAGDDGATGWSWFVEARFASAAGAEIAIGARVLDDPGDGELGFGPMYLELRRVRDTTLFGAAVSLGPSLRLDVPRTNSEVGDTTVAASPAYQLSAVVANTVRLHARAGALLFAALPEDTVETRAAILAGADVAWRPSSWLGLAVGAEAQGGWHDDGFDHLLARAAMRVAVGPVDLELGAGVPLFGDEPSDLAVAFGAVLRR